MKKQKKQNTAQSTDRIISRLHKLGFTKVKQVRDADEPVRVKVTKKDSNEGRRNEPSDCALARACVREFSADGAVINIGTSYIVKGNTAVRFKTSAGVGREITSFDRSAGFEPGNDYLLSAFPPTCRLDSPRRGDVYKKGSGDKKPGRQNVHRHHTENIRVNRTDK